MSGVKNGDDNDGNDTQNDDRKISTVGSKLNHEVKYSLETHAEQIESLEKEIVTLKTELEGPKNEMY